MFWNKATPTSPTAREPVDHSRDVCTTCGGLIDDGMWSDSPHILSECVQHQKRVIANQSTKIKNLELSGNFYSKTIAELHDRIVMLENTNRDTASLLRKTSTKMDVLEKYAPDIVKFCSQGLPPSRPKPKPA